MYANKNILIIKLALCSVPLCSVSSSSTSVIIIIIIIIKETAKKKVPFGHFALKISEENCKMPLHIFSRPTAALPYPYTVLLPGPNRNINSCFR